MEEFLTSPAGLVIAAALGLLIGAMIFNVKQWEAHWKQDAINASNALSALGLVHIPKILSELGTGDIAGAFQEVKNLFTILTDPKQRAAEFATVFQTLLTDAFKDPTQAKALQQLANDAVAAFASGNPTNAAPQLAADAQAIISQLTTTISQLTAGPAQSQSNSQPSQPTAGLTVTASGVLPGHIITATATPGSPAAAAAATSAS